MSNWPAEKSPPSFVQEPERDPDGAESSLDYAALQGLVEAIEDNNRINDAKWSDWFDANAAADLYTIEIDDNIAAIIDRAIKSNGISLPRDLRAAEHNEFGRHFSGGGYWISVLEGKYGTPGEANA